MNLKQKPFVNRPAPRKVKRGLGRSLMIFVLKVISWLLPNGSSRILMKLHSIGQALVKISDARGERGLVEYLKSTRLALLHYLSDEYPSKKVPGVQVDCDGIPKVLGVLAEELRDVKLRQVGYPICRALMTLLFSTRALSLGREPDLDPIVNPCKWVLPMDDRWARNFWQELGFRTSLTHTKIPRATRFRDYHFTGKAGPNGQALITSIQDLEQLRNQPDLLASICIVGGEKLTLRIEGLLQQFSFLKRCYPKYPSRRLRKLSVVPDKEMKVRLVAILDYFSQAALKPLHHYLYRILRRIPQDCTFDQGSFKARTTNWTEFYSIDLTAATDRFPIHFISSLFYWIFPVSFVSAWEYIMVKLPFEYRSRKGTVSVHYACGNPMGAYTSWASFALAHHFLVYQSCKDVGIEWKTAPYALLGDDLVLGDKSLADAYKYRLSRLGVEFSPIKTHESKTLFEFAKRLFLNGEEITPFPIRALWVSQKYYDLLPVLYGELNKGWQFGNEVAKVIESYYRNVKGFNASYCKEVYNKSAVCEALMLYMRGVGPAKDVINNVYRQQNLPSPPGSVSETLCENIIHLCLMEFFAASDPLSEKGKKFQKGAPLGALAESLVLKLTGGEDDSLVAWACDHISSVPFLNVYGQITEMYFALKKQALTIFANKGFWPLYLKTAGVPLSDRVFVERQRDRLARGVSQIAFSLVKTADEVFSTIDGTDEALVKSWTYNYFGRGEPPENIEDMFSGYSDDKGLSDEFMQEIAALNEKAKRPPD